MARILVADGADLKISIDWESIDKKLAAELEGLGHEVAVESLTGAGLTAGVKKFDVLIVGSTTVVNKEVIDAALETRKLRLIIKAGTGYSNIDYDYAVKNGIQVRNTPECSRNAVAELIIGHIISISRFLFQASVSMKNMEWKQSSYTGIEISERTLGLIGFDDTARLLAKKAGALGMKVLYWDEAGKADGYDDCTFMEFDKLLPECVFLSLHLDYKKELHHFMGKKEFAMMQKGANLINCSDGRLVDEKALLDALGASMAEMHLFGACLDTFEEEPTQNRALASHDRVSLSPHICINTYEADTRRIAEIASIVKELS